MKLRKIISTLVIGSLVVSAASYAHAQSRRPTGVASLGEMGCRSIGGRGKYNTTNQDVAIGREIFRAVAFLGDYMGGISRDNATQVACGLAAVNAPPQFKTLTLTFGFKENSNANDGSVIVRLSVYKDGNFYGQQTISKGDKIRWPIDVTNTRSLALEAQCVRPRQNYNSCPNIWFVEDILRR